MSIERHEQVIMDETGRYSPDEIDQMHRIGMRVKREIPVSVPKPDFDKIAAEDREQPWYSPIAENVLRAIYTGNGEAVAQIRALINPNERDVTHSPVRHLINSVVISAHFNEWQKAMVKAAIRRACGSHAELDAIED